MYGYQIHFIKSNVLLSNVLNMLQRFGAGVDKIIEHLEEKAN